MTKGRTPPIIVAGVRADDPSQAVDGAYFTRNPCITQVGRTTVYELVKGGELVSFKIGRRRLFPETAVTAFIARKLKEAANA